MTVEVGWGNTYRAGRWNPLYVTAESTPPREVIAQIEGITQAPHAMTVYNRFALSPASSTHTVYFPLGEAYELAETVLTLRDAQTRKRLASTRLAMTPPVQQAPFGEPMIGVSGDLGTFSLLKGQFEGAATVGYVAQPYLPVVPAGYDALDVLMLNAPELSKIDQDQQRAMIEWIRAGGTLVLWPGAGATPESGPLIDALPAMIGESQLIDLDPKVVESVGLARIARIGARRLIPVPDSEPIALIGERITGFRRPTGFGQIVIAPIDLATLRFTSNLAVQKFWGSMLHGVPDRTRDNQPDATVTRWLRDTSAGRARVVPLWLIVALAIVGPLDSLLLKLLRRRPWTLVTVLGWAGLIAAVTHNVREQNRERPVEYRTVRIIDEVDRAAAIVTDFVAVRWPEGESLAFPEERGAWWRPAIDPTDPPTSPRSEFHAEQSEAGTWPVRLPAQVPTPHVLEVQRWTASPSVIDASLAVRSAQITGKITNRGERPLRKVRIRTATGVAQLDVPQIEPGETAEVSAAINADDGSLQMPPPERFYTERRASDAPIPLPDYAAVEASTFLRSTRIAELLARGERACVYAEIEDPAPPAELPAPVNQKHLAFVRSLVRLQSP
ncbi:MAG TPA: hypothetical protein VGR35_05570 [Tepidisphaeraceae bacterium]|nr:hypothetical protein [Tepidisphaeraceae bacterium]